MIPVLYSGKSTKSSQINKVSGSTHLKTKLNCPVLEQLVTSPATTVYHCAMPPFQGSSGESDQQNTNDLILDN